MEGSMRYILSILTIWLATTSCSFSKPVQNSNNQKSTIAFENSEIYKTKKNTHTLTIKDVDHDGLKDMLVVDNRAAEISIYYQLTKKEMAQQEKNFYKDLKEESINTLSYNFRYKNSPFVTEKNVTSFLVADLGRSKLNDIIYLTSKGELYIKYQTDKRVFDQELKFYIPDYLNSRYALFAEDINSDGKTDLIVLSKKYINIFYQKKDGTLQEPVKHAYTAKSPLGLEVSDLNGDGRNDILFVTSGGVNFIKFRLQQKSGELGPEYTLEYPNFHYLTSQKLDAIKGKKAQLLSSRANAHMIFIDQLESVSQKDKPSPAIYSINPEAISQNKEVVFGDFNGDRQIDMVLSDASLASILFFQGEHNLFKYYKEIPSLKGITRMRTLKSGKRHLVVIYSKSEKSLGIIDLKDRKQLFPKLLDFDGDVTAFDTYNNTLIVLLKKDGKFQVVTATLNKKLDVKISQTRELKGFSGTIHSVMAEDINHDKLVDLLIFQNYDPAGLFIQNKKAFQPVKISTPAIRSLFQSISPDSVHFGDIDQDGQKELMISAKNVVRVLQFKHNQFHITHQLNGTNRNTKFTNVAFTKLFDKKLGVALFDKGNKHLSLFNQKLLKGAKHIHMPYLDPITIKSIDLNGDGVKELIFVNLRSVAIFYSNRAGYRLKNLVKYTLPHPKSMSSILELGDFDGPKIVSADGVRHFIEFYNFDGKKIDFNLRFAVFETKSYRNQSSATLEEPKEMKISDMNGDGKDDIVIRIHDRIIVYYQK